MKKPSSNQLLQAALVLALVVNCIIHFNSPAYKFYRENMQVLRNDVYDFQEKIKYEFVPAILEVASNRVVSTSPASVSVSSSSSVSSSLPLLSDTNLVARSRLFNLDFLWFNSGGVNGFELDGVRYFVGDSLFGSVIRSITPTIVVTDDYQFVRPLIREFKLDSSDHTSRTVCTVVTNQNNSSVVVPQLPEPYFKHKEKGVLYE